MQIKKRYFYRDGKFQHKDVPPEKPAAASSRQRLFISKLPDLPDVPNSPEMSEAPSNLGAGSASDPVEKELDGQKKEVDDTLLGILSFQKMAQKRAFNLACWIVGILFLLGTAIFICLSSKLWGYSTLLSWRLTLVLFAFFTPATVIFIIIIRAVFQTTKDSEKKDELTDMLPQAVAMKLIAEIFKQGPKG